MIRRYSGHIAARRLPALLAVIVLCVLVAQPWSALDLSQTPTGTGSAGASAPFGSVPVGVPGSQSNGQGPRNVGNGVTVGTSYKNDTSPRLRDIPASSPVPGKRTIENENPGVFVSHKNQPDPVVQNFLAPMAMPTPVLNFDGIGYPGYNCYCAPPDTDGEVGATQYVQLVNKAFQVFNKTTGASVLGPSSISSIWSGFGGACETGGFGDPVVLYDQIAGRWLVSQFASATGSTPITDECVAVSTTNDATGSYYRYGYHLGSNFYDYPHLAVWPDGYYMSMNVFNSAGSTYLGPQPFAFDRTSMLTGAAATYVSPVGPLGGSISPVLPADLDGSTLPPANAPATFVRYPGTGAYVTYHFHVDFTTPANSTWTTFASPAAAGFSQPCGSTGNCVPQAGVTSSNYLNGLDDRLMFRLAYRNFGSYESVVGNFTVSSGGVAGIRWFELRNVSNGPETVYQQSTYQPDTTWRWMGSAAMDQSGNMALGFSASSSSINPQLRYAGRLSTDALNTLAQGEADLYDGTGSQTGTGNRWGDYSDLTVDPVDDCTFWFTSEYYQTTGSYNWRTRIGNFKFASCGATPTNTPTSTSTRTNTPTNTNTPTSTATPTNTPTNTYTITSTSTRTNTPTSTFTSTSSPSNTATSTPIATNTPTNTRTSTSTSTSTPTDTYTSTSTPTNSPTNTYTTTSTRTSTPTNTRTSTPTNTGTTTNTPTSSPTNTHTSTPTDTYTSTSTWTGTPTNTHTSTSTPTNTPTGTRTQTATFTLTPTGTNTGTATFTGTAVPTSTGTQTSTNTPSITQTSTTVPSSTGTATQLPTGTWTSVPSLTETSTPANTTVSTATLTVVPSSTNTVTVVPSSTGTPAVTATPCTISFSDVHTTDYFYEDVRCVYCLGAVSGYSDGTFRPFNNTTRGQMTKIIVLALQMAIVTPSGTPTFNDVLPGSAFYPYVETAASAGVVSGYADGSFRPNANVTRGQLSKIVVTAANHMFAWQLLNPPAATFSDVPPGSAFYTYIETAVCRGVISGYSDNTFRPYNNAIRAQIAKIVCRTSQNPVGTCTP